MKTPFTPPTDNLHKFVSVFGLILLLSSGLLIYWASTVTAAKLQHYGFEIMKAEETIAEMVSETSLTQVNIHKKRIEINSQLKNFHYSIFRVQMIVASLLFFSGVHQIFFGFRNWRRKVQNYSDEYLKFEVEKIKLECKLLEMKCKV